MKAITTGTLIDDVVQLDARVNLPDRCRVSVSIEPLELDIEPANAALERFLKRAGERAFDSGGTRLTRDELHSRQSY